MQHGFLPTVDRFYRLRELRGRHLFDLDWLHGVCCLHQLRCRFVFYFVCSFCFRNVLNLRGGNLFHFNRRVELFDLHKLR